MLEIVEETCPNGSKFYSFFIGKTLIGSAVKFGIGWLVSGKRKPVYSDKEAAKQMIDFRMNKCISELEKWRKLGMKLHSR